MSEKVMVSINCITYNQEEYIAKAIDSFLMQKTDFKYEILIHDDASTDNTANIIREYQEKYPDIIKPIYQKENQYSQGIKRVDYKFNYSRANGKYIAICEGDDYWTDPFKLQKQVDYMEANPECTLCTHAVEKIDASTNKSKGLVRPYNYSSKCSMKDVIEGGGGFVGTNSLLFPKKSLENAPSWYLDCIVGDYPLQILLSYKGYAYYIDENMSVYRTNAKGSWTKSMNDNKIEKYTNLMNNINIMLDQFNIYSNKEYEEIISASKKNNEFEKAVVKSDLKILKQSQFKSLYSRLRIKTKIRVLIEYYFNSLKNICKA